MHITIVFLTVNTRTVHILSNSFSLNFVISNSPNPTGCRKAISLLCPMCRATAAGLSSQDVIQPLEQKTVFICPADFTVWVTVHITAEAIFGPHSTTAVTDSSEPQHQVISIFSMSHIYACLWSVLYSPDLQLLYNKVFMSWKRYVVESRTREAWTTVQISIQPQTKTAPSSTNLKRL